MWSGSLLQLEQSGSLARTATGGLLDDCLCSDEGNPPEVTFTALASSITDLAGSHGTISRASCLAALSVATCSFAGALQVLCKIVPVRL